MSDKYILITEDNLALGAVFYSRENAEEYKERHNLNDFNVVPLPTT